MKSDEIIHIGTKQFSLLFSEETILKRVELIADLISSDYQDRKITVIVVLKGAFIFAADLIRKLTSPCEIYFSNASSYGNDSKSSGILSLSLPDIDYNDRDILIVEDIVDTGRTLNDLTLRIKHHNICSLKSAVLLSKPVARVFKIEPDYCCFEIPEAFVVGYGLDYAQIGRDLPCIYSEFKI
jgi:hypoxanthine phosphoribosyltransferase